MITQTELESINPYKLDDSVLDDIKAVGEFENSLDWVDDDLLDEVINSRKNNDK